MKSLDLNKTSLTGNDLLKNSAVLERGWPGRQNPRTILGANPRFLRVGSLTFLWEPLRHSLRALADILHPGCSFFFL